MGKKARFEDSLKAQRPDLMTEWDGNINVAEGIYPEMLTPFSHQKVSWLCSLCGNRWLAEVNSRSRGSRCPKCKGQKISKAKRKVKNGNSLAERFPHVAEEWHPEKNGAVIPQAVNSGSSDKFWWKCRYGHEWEATIYSRTYGHSNCPKCSEEMHTSFPEQAVFFFLSNHFDCQNRAIIQNCEIDVFIPALNVGIEYDGRYYHKAAARIREEKKDAFFQSIGIRIIRVKEDTVNLVETDCIRYIYSSSNYRHLDWAISELLKMFKIEERIDVGINQVNIMARYIQSIKANSLKRMYPNLAAEWACEQNGSIMPDMVTAGSHREVYWKCKNGHIYSASINARVRYYKQGKYFGCQYCSGHKALPGYNDLQTKYPDIAKEWDWEKMKE